MFSEVEESSRHCTIIEDNEKHARVWLELSTLNINAEIEAKVIAEIRETKERIKKILAE